MPVFVCVHHTRTSRARQSANDIAAQFAWAPSEAWGQGGWLGGLRGPTPCAREHAHDRWATIDTHAGQFAVQEWTRLLARRNELAVYRTLVRLGGGVQRGK